MKKILLVVSLGLALSACANKGTIDKDAQITQDWSVEKLYAEAQDELNSNNYTRAVKLYEILESRFPNGRYAQQSQLDTAYAYYKDDEPEKPWLPLRASNAIIRNIRIWTTRCT